MADLILALLILVVTYMMVARIFDDSAGAVAVSRSVDLSAESRGPAVREVADRGAYDRIVQANLYGPAGATRVEEPEPEPVVQEPEERLADNLPLRLFGTMAAYPTDPLGSAFIENSNSRSLKTYFINQEVMDDIVLQEINRQQVILYNAADNTRLVLAMDRDAPSGAMQTASMNRSDRGRPSPQQPQARQPQRPDRDQGSIRRPPEGGGRNQVVLDRNELIQEMSQENYAELYSQISPELVSDESGDVVGITSPNIGDIPLARQFGFQEGDVVQQINGVQIDSEARVIEVLNRFQNAPTHWVSVLRNGRPETIVFRLE